MWDPFQMAHQWLIDGGDPNRLPTGMILQAVVWRRCPPPNQIWSVPSGINYQPQLVLAAQVDF